ncbi:MAG: thioesterase [Maricaulis sp.]|nr:thioesterase [Maricaulis sp.]|tara:strand:+ start:91 stop:513 length:423 start_codon:yes stop_codon:yes gene_type:complete
MSEVLLETLLATPFVSRIGVQVEQKGTELTGVLPFQDTLVGNPLIPALHGGAVGAFLEVVASASLLVSQPMARLPRPIDVAIDYLRPARAQDVYARAIVARSGRRVANVRVEAWQGRTEAPVATLHGHFLITPKGADDES